MEFESQEDRIARAARELSEQRVIVQPDIVPEVQPRTTEGRYINRSESLGRGDGVTTVNEEEENQSVLPGSSAEEAARYVAGVLPAVGSAAAEQAKNWIETQPLYRTLMLTDEQKLEDAKKIADAMGMNANVLATNQWLYDDAKTAYDNMQKRAFLNGKPFSANTIKEMYPEVDIQNPVEAAMALREANSIATSREIIENTRNKTLGDMVQSEWDFLKNQYRQGVNIDTATEIQYAAAMGEISDDEARKRLARIQEMKPDEGSGLNYIAGQAIQQGTMQARQMWRAAQNLIKSIPLPPGLLTQVMQSAPAVVVGAGALAATAAGAAIPLTAALAVSGIGAFDAAVFASSYRAQLGSNYWNMRQKQDRYGRPLYTREEALSRARAQAIGQAAVETGVLKYALGPITKAFGKDAAMSIIENASARTRILDAGKAAMRKYAAMDAVKQFGKGAAAEVAEEGVQQAISDVDEYIFGKDKQTGKQMLDNAVEAMIQAVPAVIGLMAPGAVIRGAGVYRGMRRLSQEDIRSARDEYRRESEQDMTAKVIESRAESGLFKKSPDIYGKVIQRQMEQNDMGTVYIDAAKAAETEPGQQALRSLEEEGAVTHEQVTQAIADGRQLEVKSGLYMQTVSEETDTALKDYKTFDKNGPTLDDIKTWRENMKRSRETLAKAAEERKQRVASQVINETLPEDGTERTSLKRDILNEILSGGMDHVKENYQRLKKEALDAWGEMTGVKPYLDYKGQGVGIMHNVAEHGGWESTRVTANEGWYSEFYKEHGRAPGQRERYDIADKEARAPMEASMDPEAATELEHLNAAKNRAEALEELDTVVNGLDIPDLEARSLLSEKAYDLVYKPVLETLSNGPEKAAKAARESAIIMGRMADAFAVQYGVPVEKIAGRIMNGGQGADGYFFSPAVNLSAGEQKWISKRTEELNEFLTTEQRTAEREKFEKSNPIYVKPGIYGNKYKSGQAIKSMQNDFRKEHPDGIAVNTEIGEVLLTARSIKNSLNHGYNGRKLDVVSSLAKGIRNAAYIGSLRDFDGKAIIDHFFAYKIRYGEENMVTLVRVKESPKHKNFYVHEIYTLRDISDLENQLHEMDAKKDKQSVTRVQTKGSQKKWGPAYLYKYILHCFLTGRNISFAFDSWEDSAAKAYGEKPFYQMAGEHAATAMVGRLQNAETMERNGASPEEIWKETGWMRGPDHKWRFEIPDNLDKIHFPNDQGTHTLGEIYDNPALYEAYPDLHQLNVRTEDAKSSKDKRVRGANGYVDEDGTIVIDKNLSEDEAKTTLVHEIQHAIQKREGFSRGGNKEMAKKYISDTIDRLSMDLMDVEFKDPKAKEYMDLAEEIANSFYETDVIGSLTKIKDLTEKRKKLLESLPEGERKELSTIERDINLLEDAMKQDDYAAYRRLGGEAEAFMTEDRAKNPSSFMPSYDTPYGPAVINFAGESLPFKAAEPDLVVTHNTTEEKLEKTIQLGGFPMPSLGISKKGMKNRLEGFGEITLLGNRDMIDPRKSRNNDVFSRDAYTVRKPVVNYEEPSEKDQLAFYKKYEVAKDELREKGIDAEDIDFSAYDGEQILNRFNRDPIVRYYYIKNVLGKDVPVKKITIHPEVRNKRFFDKYPEVLKALKSDKIREGDYSELDKATKPYFDHLQNRIDEKKGLIGLYKKRIRKMTTDGHINKEGAFMLWKWMDDYEEDVKKKSYETVDKPAFQKDTDRLITEAGIEKFNDYIQKEFENLYKEKYLWDKGKKYKFTLANIVKLMKKDRGADSEGAPGNYGFNSLLAYLSRQFTSIRDIKKNEGMLQPNEKELAQYKKTEAMYTDLLDEAAQLKGKYDESIDTDLAELIKDVRDGKNGDMHGFPKNKEFMDHIRDLLKQIGKVTTDYFEAKPARAVSFSEFSGAVVPENIKPEIIRYLENQGIAVETYDPKVEGDQKAKAEELAGKLNVYFQGNGRYAGSYDARENVIRIFSAANESTAVHEAAHWWLTMLERFSEDESLGKTSANKMQHDLWTIRKWAAYSEEHMAEYKGTALEKEFAGYEAAIRKNPNNMEIQERFMQERFARGFERYLATGKAPTKEIRGVFRRFKAFMAAVYREVKSLGLVDPPKDIKNIFDHILATDEEIEAWAQDKRILSMDRVGIDYTKTEKENINSWIEDIKESAKEKCMSYFMSQYRSDAMKSLEEGLNEQVPDVINKLIDENPLYKTEQTFRSDIFPSDKDRMDYLHEKGFNSKEELEAALKEAGGTLEERVNKWKDEARQQFVDSLLTEDQVREAAEEQLASAEGQLKLSDMETAALNRKINNYIRQAVLAEMELKNAKPEDRDKIALKIKERLGMDTTEEKEKIAHEDLQSRLRSSIESMKSARDMLTARPKSARRSAKQALENMPISQATNWKWWQKKAEQAHESFIKDVKRGQWGSASALKLYEEKYMAMAAQARKNEEQLRGLLRGNPKAFTATVDKNGLERYGILGIVNRIGRKEDPVLMQDSCRYFVQHMAYQLGLTKNDGTLPLGPDGNPMPFSWEKIAYELNPGKAMEMDMNRSGDSTLPPYMGDDVISPEIKNIFSGPRVNFNELNLNKALSYIEAMKRVYKMGRREYEGNTLEYEGKSLSFEEASRMLVSTPWKAGIVLPFEDKQRRTTLQRVAHTLGKAMLDLTLPDIILERLGPKWYAILKTPMEKGQNMEREMTEKATKSMQTILKMYSLSEWQKIRSEKKYEIGKSARDKKPLLYTKEQILVIALNWGTDSNRRRVLSTLASYLPPGGYTPDEIDAIQMGYINGLLEKYMTDKDWDFVEAIWKDIDQYWGGVNKVKDNLYGVPLGKIEGMTFKLENGRTIHGSYYPVKYDADVSTRTAELSANEIADQQKMGFSTFSLGTGSTKSRNGAPLEQKLRLDLGVYPQHLKEVIHYTCMRECTVDVYKLLNDPTVRNAIVSRVGEDSYETLKQWASDCWHGPLDRMTEFQQIMEKLRGRTTFATMAFRTSTALLNATNIFPFMDKLGVRNAISALADYYLVSPSRRKQLDTFIDGKSSMMRDRAQTMDKDLQKHMNFPVGQNEWKFTSHVIHGKYGVDAINQQGYRFIAWTDRMLSKPEWVYAYKGKVRELLAAGYTEEQADSAAILFADKTVRDTFGSGEMKDRPNVLKNGFMKEFLPFYTYSNLVLNQFIKSGYAIKDRKDFGPMIRSILFWWVLTSIGEASIRYGMNMATGKDDDFLKRLVYTFAGGGPLGGIPFIGSTIQSAAAKAMGMFTSDPSVEPLSMQFLEDAWKVYTSLTSDKKTWIDVGRAATRVGNRYWGFSDTLTDGFWTGMRFATEETKASVWEVMAAIAMDRDLPKDKKKK